jgi:cobalt/nickel transport system permease protein
MTGATLAAAVPRASPIQRLDPRAKLLLVLGALLVVLSEPPGAVSPFAAYFALILSLLAVGRVSPRLLAWRVAAVAPIVVGAAALLLLAGGEAARPETALSMVLRAFAAVALATLLVATERMSGILWGLSALGMPRLFCTLSAFMYRYALLLADEAARIERARRSRTPGPLRAERAPERAQRYRVRIRTLGAQAALVFLRGWKRSQAVHAAMLARGFTGHFPFAPPGPLPTRHLAVVAAGLAAFLAIRLAWP